MGGGQKAGLKNTQETILSHSPLVADWEYLNSALYLIFCPQICHDGSINCIEDSYVIQNVPTNYEQ